MEKKTINLYVDCSNFTVQCQDRIYECEYSGRVNYPNKFNVDINQPIEYIFDSFNGQGDYY